MPDFYTEKDGILTLSLRVTPNAKRDGFEGVWNGTHLRLALRAPAVEGKANAAVIEYLSKIFNVKKNDVEILSGLTGRQKIVKIKYTGELPADIYKNSKI